jgi:hypothetical protein
MKTKWYERRPNREAERAELERQATRLIRNADRRAQRSKLKSPSPPPSPAATPSKWMPLTDLRRVMRAKERTAR